VKQAPYEEVKAEAIYRLSKGVNVYNMHPTQEISAAIVEVGSCPARE
jgi:hypothetical protein